MKLLPREWCLLALGMVALGVYSFETAGQQWLADSTVADFRTGAIEQSKRQESMATESMTPDTTLWSPVRIERYDEAVAAGRGRPLGVMSIPALDLDAPLYSGTSDHTLDRGLGWIEGTSVPGADTGNVGIAGHRDGFFRVLKDVDLGDEIFIEMPDGSVDRFEVVHTEVVMPSDVSVLESSGGPSVTLVTCYPFYHVGNAPERFIVHALPVEDDTLL